LGVRAVRDVAYEVSDPIAENRPHLKIVPKTGDFFFLVVSCALLRRPLPL